MAIARNTIVYDETESSYHIVTRCVRRAFICGYDSLTGNNYDYRKGWIKTRLEVLSNSFGVDVCGYAVMSNHLHLVIRTRPDVWQKWSDLEVAARWWQLFPRRRDENGNAEEPTDSELGLITKDKKRLKLLRHRLGEVSWFMRCLNEYIARKANKEDECTGRFWEGRFKCQALLDEAAELACMAYVDLNPIRAKLADTPEESEFTSVKARIDSAQARAKVSKLNKIRRDSKKTGRELNSRQLKMITQEQKKCKLDHWLNPIGIQRGVKNRKGILCLTQDEYLSLLDWTGRCIKAGKRGVIPSNLKPILERLSIDVNNWVDTVISFGKVFYRVAGSLNKLMERATQVGQNFFRGMSASKRCFSSQ